MLATGNSALEMSGAIQPSNDGPSRIPANISPTTWGCLMALKSTPVMRAASRTTLICKMSLNRSTMVESSPAGNSRLDCPEGGRRTTLDDAFAGHSGDVGLEPGAPYMTVLEPG